MKTECVHAAPKEKKTRLCRCVRCGKTVETSSARTKYCAVCRKQVLREMYRERYRNKHLYTPKVFSDYVCAVCNRRIRVYGRTYPRKYCDACLPTLGKQGRKMLMQRKNLPEEVISDAGN